MKSLCCIISFIGMLSLSQLLSASSSSEEASPLKLKPFVATYMITVMGLEGVNVTNSLSLDKNTGDQQEYHFKSYSMPVGLLAFKKNETRNEQSSGLIHVGRVYPEHYSYQQIRDNKVRRDVEIQFNWRYKTVTNHHKHKDSKWTMPISMTTTDKLSYHLALMLKLKNNPEKQFSLTVADGGKLKEYHFELLGEEQVHTSSGSYKALKIHHTRYKKDKKITLWCAPELNYLPVKIIQEETDKPTFISTLLSYQEGLSGD